MNWFSGDIADAVRISKDKNVIFVVFIAGKNDESAAFDVLFNDPSVCGKLNDVNKFLSIRIESDTDTYKQFVQIYRLVPVPSVFFIGHFGQPIAIVAGTIPSVEGFEERIALAEKEFHQPKTESSSSTTAPPQPTTPQNVAGHSSKATGTTKSSVEQSQEPRLSKEDLEMQQLKENRRREKAADDEARQRVLQQIKMDRLRRQPNWEPVSDSKPVPTVTPVTAPVRNVSDVTRIQFRKPTGETITDTFQSGSPFGDVWKYAQASIGIKNFVLATTLPPRRELSADHSTKTLVELDLVPSAVLLVIPLSTPSLVGGGSGGALAKITGFMALVFWTLVGPILSMWNRFRGGSARNGSQQQAPPTPTPGTDTATDDAPNIGSEVSRKRNLARFNLGPSGGASSTSSVEKQKKSNIHRLGDYGSDDDENNTYNGNSTQQM